MTNMDFVLLCIGLSYAFSPTFLRVISGSIL